MVFLKPANLSIEHPNRFIGFGDVKLDDPDVLNQIDRFHQAGFRGLGEITSALKNYDDRAYWPIYDRAAKYHMILLFHTGIVARPDPRYRQISASDPHARYALDLIARHWPKTIIIGAHLGNPDYAEAAEVARLNSNLYFDLSGSSLIKKKDDYDFFRSIFWWSGVVSSQTPPGAPNAFERLVFGSDIFNGEVRRIRRRPGALSRHARCLPGADKRASQYLFRNHVENPAGAAKRNGR